MTTIDKQQRKKETASIHINMEIKNQLLTIARTFQSNSKLTQYFYDRFSDYYNKDNRSLSEKKVIATTCLYVPDELIYAIDAIPLRVCNGSFSLDQIGGEFMPSKSCPMAKSSLGMFHLNEYPMGAKPELIIVPTSCDQKKKLPEMLPNHEIEIYPLEVPPGKESEASLLFWYRSISKLVEKLEKISGKKNYKKKTWGSYTENCLGSAGISQIEPVQKRATGNLGYRCYSYSEYSLF